MSKSKGKVVSPEDLITGDVPELQRNKSLSNIKGAETLRFYCIGVTQPGRDFNFSLKEYTDTYKILNTIWNVYVYAHEKFNLAEFNPSKVQFDLKKISKFDKWILSRLNSTIKKITQLSDEYQLPWITGELRDFAVNDISRWYIMLNREKLDVYSEDPNKLQIMSILYHVLYNYLLLLAPVNPMMTEEIYLKMFKKYSKLMGLGEAKSIHLQDWPQFNEKLIDIDLENQMIFIRDLIENVRALKDENNIRLRWPNKRLIIEPKEGMPEIEFPDIVKQIGNVRDLVISKSVKDTDQLLKMETKLCNIYLDISLDDELLAERVVNDLIRNIQYSRKRNNYNVGENIELNLSTKADYLSNYLNKNKDLISEKVTASNIEVTNQNLKKEKEKVHGQLHICPNRECSASLKDNIVSRFKKQSEVKCPYCETNIKEKDINLIEFEFNRQK